MAEKIRKGNDIQVQWTVLDGSNHPYDLSGRDIEVRLVCYGWNAPVEFSVGGTNHNVITFTFWGKDQQQTGSYALLLIENNGKQAMITHDRKDAFILVAHSWETGGSSVSGITVTSLSFTSTASMGVVGPRGLTGNGIDHIELNNDYTLSIYYTDGTSMTTGPIRGEKGEQGDSIYDLAVKYHHFDGTEAEFEQQYQDALHAAIIAAYNCAAASALAAQDHTQAASDHTRAEADHTQAASDHTRAGQDHTQAASDHSTAASDHSTAASDHSRAESDHNTAAADHTQAASDHTTAAADHTQAASDHTQSASDHTTAVADHTQAASDHTTATADHETAEDDHTQAADDHAIMQNYDDRLAVVEGEAEASNLESVEGGEFHVGPNLNIAYQYTAAGFDAAKVSAHFISLIAAGLCITDMEEEGFAIVGEDLGIVLLVNGTGVHAPNLVEYQNI